MITTSNTILFNLNHYLVWITTAPMIIKADRRSRRALARPPVPPLSHYPTIPFSQITSHGEATFEPSHYPTIPLPQKTGAPHPSIPLSHYPTIPFSQITSPGEATFDPSHFPTPPDHTASLYPTLLYPTIPLFHPPPRCLHVVELSQLSQLSRYRQHCPALRGSEPRE